MLAIVVPRWDEFESGMRGSAVTGSPAKEGRKEMFYLTTHSTHFIYGYMASDIWLRTILIVRKETRCSHIGYFLWLTTSVLLYPPSYRQDSTCHSLCYTSHGALAGTRNSLMGSPHEGSIQRPIAPWANSCIRNTTSNIYIYWIIYWLLYIFCLFVILCLCVLYIYICVWVFGFALCIFVLCFVCVLLFFKFKIYFLNSGVRLCGDFFYACVYCFFFKVCSWVYPCVCIVYCYGSCVCWCVYCGFCCVFVYTGVCI